MLSCSNSWLTVPFQTVDATPSDRKMLSKVVFMRPGRRFGLSAEQKCDVWRRWKAGQTLHEIGRVFGKEISRGLASGSSFREIAKCLERAVSTVSREVARHGGRPAYRIRRLVPKFAGVSLFPSL